VRHEALVDRMGVRDLRRLAVVAAGWSWRQSSLRIGGVGGSSLDKVGSAQDYRMGRARWARREGIRKEPVLLRLFRQRQLQPGGCGLVRGADPLALVVSGNSWSCLLLRARRPRWRSTA